MEISVKGPKQTLLDTVNIDKYGIKVDVFKVY